MMSDSKDHFIPGANAKLSSSDFVTERVLLTLGCHPLLIQETASRFGKLFRESLASGHCPFSLEPTHLFTSPVVMSDLHLASDADFWSKTFPQCLASRLPRDYWWHVVSDAPSANTPEWDKLLAEMPASCVFWQRDMQMQLNHKRLLKHDLQFKFADHRQPLKIWMTPVNRLHCIAVLFPPFQPAELFATDALPSLVHHMLWRMDSVRAGRICTIYAPDQLLLVPNRRRAFVLARGGLLTGLPGRLTEPESYVNSRSDPPVPKRIDSRYCFLTLLHTYLYAEVMDKLRVQPPGFLNIADGLVHTVISRYLGGQTQASDTKSQLRSARQGVVFPNILPSKLSNERMQHLFDVLRARYDQLLSHTTAALKNLQDVLTGTNDLEESQSIVLLSLMHAVLATSFPSDSPTFSGHGTALELRNIRIIPSEAAYQLLIHRMYIAQAENLHALVKTRETKMDIWDNGKPVHGNQSNDIVCLVIDDVHCEALHDSLAFTCGERAPLISASWLEPACPESATQSLLVVTSATLWQYQRIALLGSYLPDLFVPGCSLHKKTDKGNADGKEWTRLSHAAVVEQMCMSKYVADGLEILRQWLGLGRLTHQDTEDAGLKLVIFNAVEMLKFFFVWLSSDTNEQNNDRASEERLRQVTNRIKVILAYSPDDAIRMPSAMITVIEASFVTNLRDDSESSPEWVNFKQNAQIVIDESSDSKTATEQLDLHIDYLLLLLVFLAQKAHRVEVRVAMSTLLDSCRVVRTAGDIRFGVDNDEAYSLDNLKLQLNRARPADKHEFTAADCACHQETHQFSINMAQLVAYIERLFYRPTPAIAAVVQQNMAFMLDQRDRLHYCPAMFDMPVAWYRTTSGTVDLHLRTKLPVWQTIVDNDLDAPSSLRFMLKSMDDQQPCEHLYERYNAKYGGEESKEAKVPAPAEAAVVRQVPAPVQRVGSAPPQVLRSSILPAVIQPRPISAIRQEQQQHHQTAPSPPRDPRLRASQQQQNTATAAQPAEAREQNDFGDFEDASESKAAVAPMDTASDATKSADGPAAAAAPVTIVIDEDEKAAPAAAAEATNADESEPARAGDSGGDESGDEAASQPGSGDENGSGDDDEDDDVAWRRRRRRDKKNKDAKAKSLAEAGELPAAAAAADKMDTKADGAVSSSSSSNATPPKKSRSRSPPRRNRSRSHSPKRRKSRSRSPARRRRRSPLPGPSRNSRGGGYGGRGRGRGRGRHSPPRNRSPGQPRPQRNVVVKKSQAVYNDYAKQYANRTKSNRDREEMAAKVREEREVERKAEDDKKREVEDERVKKAVEERKQLQVQREEMAKNASSAALSDPAAIYLSEPLQYKPLESRRRPDKQ